MEWSEKGALPAAQQTAVAEAAPAPKAALPDVPPNIDRCIRYGLARAKAQQAAKGKAGTRTEKPAAAPKRSADELAIAQMKAEDDRNKCALAVLRWYQEIQKANAKAAAKT